MSVNHFSIGSDDDEKSFGFHLTGDPFVLIQYIARTMEIDDRIAGVMQAAVLLYNQRKVEEVMKKSMAGTPVQIVQGVAIEK
jgi:hypothetical protein